MTGLLRMLAAACTVAIAGAASAQLDIEPRGDDGAAAVDFLSLVRAVADESRGIAIPGVVFSSAIHSSRDLGSIAPDEPISWFSEADSGNAIRVERIDGRSEWVLAELKGSGALTRLVLNATVGTRDAVLRIRLDGGPEPVVEWRLRDIEGEVAPLLAPFLSWEPEPLPPLGPAPTIRAEPGVGTVDCSLPIPFARSCVVTLDRRPDLYRIESVAFAEGVRVTPLAQTDLARSMPELRTAGEAMQARVDSRPNAGSTGLVAEPLAPAARIERVVETGGVIRRLAVRIDPMQALRAVRELWVECDFDGEASLRMPLGHFIGLGEGSGPTADAFRAVGADGSMEFRLPMPFARSARVAIANRGAAPLGCALAILELTPPEAAGPPQLLHGAVRFHNRLAVSAPIEVELARIEGSGVLVAETHAHFAAMPNWWPTGDDRWRIDGRDELAGPSFDLAFGSAPGLPRLSRGTLVAIPARADHHGAIRWSAARVRRLDALRFSQSLVGSMELFPVAAPTAIPDCEISLAHGVLWYAAAGASRGVGFDDPAAMPGVATPRNLAPLRETFPPAPGAEWFEFEQLPISRWVQSAYWAPRPFGTSSPQHAWGNGWCIGMQAIGVGDFIEFVVPARDAGPRRLEVRFAQLLEAAKIAVTVNGTRVPGEIALTSPTPEPSELVDIGVHAPKDGAFIVRFAAAGYGEGSRTRMHMQMDGIRVSPP
ncbi:MAG: DUF2961 domain-containing protein [Phycisphaera sp.]|nr:DUF2961 domain-containing protein [Phycisphaera sp.]